MAEMPPEAGSPAGQVFPLHSRMCCWDLCALGCARHGDVIARRKLATGWALRQACPSGLREDALGARWALPPNTWLTGLVLPTRNLERVNRPPSHLEAWPGH